MDGCTGTVDSMRAVSGLKMAAICWNRSQVQQKSIGKDRYSSSKAVDLVFISENSPLLFGFLGKKRDGGTNGTGWAIDRISFPAGPAVFCGLSIQDMPSVCQ